MTVKCLVIHGNHKYLVNKKLASIKSKASKSGLSFFFREEDGESKRSLKSELDDSYTEYLWTNTRYLHLLDNPPTSEISSLTKHLESIDEGLFVVLIPSKLRGSSKWRKQISESDFFVEFEFNKPEKRDEARFASSHARASLQAYGLSCSTKMLNALCQESNNDVEHIDAQIRKIALLAEIEGSKEVKAELIRPVFIRPYEKKIHGLIKAIESRSVKMLIRALDIILDHPKDDPTWPICRYLQKMVQSWIGMSLDVESGRDLSKNWSGWEVNKFLDIKSRWSKSSLINLLDQVNLCLRHILENGTMNKSAMYSNLIYAFIHTEEGV